MDREMKFHIYNRAHEPLCWDDKTLEFDFAEDAHDFMRDINEGLNEEYYVVVQDILYYDGGYINATGLRIQWEENIEDCILVKVEGR